MQHARGRADEDISVGDDVPVVPALSFVIVHDEHVVGKLLAKHQLVGIGLGFGVGVSGHRKCVTHLNSPLLFLSFFTSCRLYG
ncbi:hypothetical protein SDC9_188541 [bioreactor metagenome]|uniref:Uncharacterized protein n=1 Tax=bioreactor metagenome TaxID=1076179 RepID=A0A645HPM1_9ZZZZ